jgi:hypothetical protein
MQTIQEIKRECYKDQPEQDREAYESIHGGGCYEVSGGQRSITGVTRVDEKGGASLDFNEDGKLLAAAASEIWLFRAGK